MVSCQLPFTLLGEKLITLMQHCKETVNYAYNRTKELMLLIQCLAVLPQTSIPPVLWNSLARHHYPTSLSFSEAENHSK